MKKTDPQNPLGIIAIDHLEFCCDSLEGPTSQLFYTFGFSQSHRHSELNAAIFTQGQIRFLLTATKDSAAPSYQYLQKHGEGVSKISFVVENAEDALAEALRRGAKMTQDLKVFEGAEGQVKTAAIQGFGDVLNEFVERPRAFIRPGFQPLNNDPKATPLTTRVARIDHLTNNVPKGEMKHWVDFYQRVYGFQVTRYFDIKGAKTGLYSEVVQSSNGAVIIPINEPDTEHGKSQIQEFLDRHKGPGVQHVALSTPDLIDTLRDLQERGIKFLDIPSTYYEDISKRQIQVEEDLRVLEERKILVDGDLEGYLLQIFSDTYIGPLFFEFIQRKNHKGFGEGNFQALFDAIERDQLRRGYLK